MEPPARAIEGMDSALSPIMVSGPGQNSAARERACAGTRFQKRPMASGPCTMRLSGFTSGRPLTAYILSTAAASSPLAARP